MWTRTSRTSRRTRRSVREAIQGVARLRLFGVLGERRAAPRSSLRSLPAIGRLLRGACLLSPPSDRKRSRAGRASSPSRSSASDGRDGRRCDEQYGEQHGEQHGEWPLRRRRRPRLPPSPPHPASSLPPAVQVPPARRAAAAAPLPLGHARQRHPRPGMPGCGRMWKSGGSRVTVSLVDVRARMRHLSLRFISCCKNENEYSKLESLRSP